MGSDKVVSLTGTPLVSREVRLDVVEALERLLEEAKAGEVVGVIVPVLFYDGATAIREAGLATRALIGAAVVAQHMLVKAVDEE